MADAITLDALIVKHIADLDAAQRRIFEKIDPRLRDEASAVMKKRADKLGWVHEVFNKEGDWAICVAPEEWIKRNQGGKDDTWLVYFQLHSLDADGGLTHVWHLTDFLEIEAGSTRKALSFFQDVLKPRDWRAVLNNSLGSVQALRDLGFDVDERKGTIARTVRLDSATLQRGFDDDDLDDALTPVGAALDLAERALPHFQVLAAAALASRKDLVAD